MSLTWGEALILINFLTKKYSPKTSSSELRSYDSAAINKLKGMSTRRN